MSVTLPAPNTLSSVKIGLALALLCIVANIALGALFGLNEDLFQNYIHAGIAAHPELFPNAATAQNNIWRWVQRAHMHAGGIGGFTLALVILTALTDMSPSRKQITAALLGLSIFYPAAWLVLFWNAPIIGTKAAHGVFLAELFTDIGIGALCLGLLSLILGIFLPKKA